MNVAFILGNGFDLQLGMETRYSSFLDWYIQKMDGDDEDISNFKKYLSSNKKEWWSDAEIAMGQYLGKFSDENISIFFKNIRNFKLRLAEYLSIQNAKYDIENDPDIITAFKDFLIQSASDIMLRPSLLTLDATRRGVHTAIHFITFNYTDALDRLILQTKQSYPQLETINGYHTTIGRTFHIHGSLDSSIIMGVDNHKQLDDTNITDRTKLVRTLIKPIINEEMGRNEHENAMYTLDDCRYLFFYGLSFGETDMTWWNLIRDHLIKKPNSQAVIFTRSSANDIQTIIPEDVLDYVNDKKDEFLKKIGIEPNSEHYDTVRKRVFVIRNTKRLNISIKDRKIPANV